ncbi:MAG: cytochrome c [Bdellovibrionales bacterium]|nr:cytochrome c [Bdellovibrionales bacterium]
MRKRLLGVAFLLLFFPACSHVQKTVMAVSGNPYEGSSDLLPLGEATYKSHCTRCHGMTGLGDGPDSSTLTVALPNFSDGSYDKSLGLVAGNITYGKREEMPAFQDQLSEKEIWSVASYIQSLRQKT